MEDLDAVLDRFTRVVGEKHWITRAAAIRAEAKGHPYLENYLAENNAIALALDSWSSSERRGVAGSRNLCLAFGMAAQALAVIQNSSAKCGRQFVRRLHGAFRNPDGLRALQLEFAAAAHFIRRGCAISWPEMDGSGRFDILVDGVGRNGLEIECKSTEIDKGRRIHTRDALILNHLMRERLEHISRRLTNGLAVVLTVPARLPTSLHGLRKLADQVRDAVLIGKTAELEDGSEVRVAAFDIAAFPRLGPIMSRELREDLDKITGTKNREVMIMGTKKTGALVFAMQSRQDDNLLRYVFNAVKEAARGQLSGDRAGLVLVRLEGISGDDLIELAQDEDQFGSEPIALRVGVSRFLGGSSADHVIGVGFLSREQLTPTGDGHMKSNGTAYHFPKTDGKFWHEDFRGMFDIRS